MKTITLIVITLLTCVAFAFTRSGNPLATTAYRGMADASAIEMLGPDYFVVANDEDNFLRIYRRDYLEHPVRSIDLKRFLNVDGKGAEVDLEACARIGDTLFWISSHGRNRSGEVAEPRHRLLATKLGTVVGVPWVHPVGTPCSGLLEAILADPRFADLGLKEAALLAPKTPGGLNIEGLTATPDGTLLIGFRNPTPQGKALVIPLLNPFPVIGGQAPSFGDPLLLPLGGQGIRGLTSIGEGYWILAGPIDGAGEIELFRWAGRGSDPTPWPNANLTGFKAEGIAPLEESNRLSLVLVSDDGTQPVGGRPAKRVKDPYQQTFRLGVIPLSPATVGTPPPGPAVAVVTDAGLVRAR